LDGTKDDTYFGIMGAINIASEPSEKAIRRLQKLYLDNLKSLVTTKVLTLFTVKQMIDDMSSDLELFKTGKIDISNFLNYEEGERIFSIQLALKFAEMENSYDYEIGFNKNLMNAIKNVFNHQMVKRK